ncbi:hypothetical protein BDQ17DRAFT_1344415 [Cyathus striatus]|nr:hypothetical protein BDQ17DRAFT_1344415 [Cyathus striatus]
MDHESASASGSKNSRRSSRLSGKGVQILKDYLAQHINEGYPSLDDRRELRDKIRKLPGLDEYPLVNVNNWFQRHLPDDVKAISAPSKLHGKAGPEKRKVSGPPAPPTPISKYPSLTLDSAKHLSILAQAQPNPPAEVILTWALLLNAQAQDVTAWLQANCSPPPPTPSTIPLSLTPSGMPSTPFMQVPPVHTPMDVQSPQGRPASYTPTTMTVPIVPFPVKRSSVPVSSMADSTMDVDVPPPNPKATALTLTKSAMGIIPPQPVGYPFASGAPSPAQGASRTHARPTVQSEMLRANEAPTNAQEFKALFAPYEEKMKIIMQKLA